MYSSCIRLQLLACFLLAGFSVSYSQFVSPVKLPEKSADDLKTGAQQTEKYFSLIRGKTVAVVAHPASLVNKTHLVDTLVKSGMKVKKIFAPEHGFRGNVEAGAKIKSGIDEKTGLPVVSLYGKNFKPRAEDLKGVDVVVFDLQDVGARFYTYISTLHYVMEACAENKKQLIVLDRPNPNGYYVDGPVLEVKQKSFTGMHPVPIIHGMTIGEYARMINGEKWLAGGIQCPLEVIPVQGYTHNDLYQLPMRPSPNLPSMTSIYLYPSLCLFEGTIVSVGRGTDKPFEQFGYPELVGGNVMFTPAPVKGASENPLYNGQPCHAYDVSDYGQAYVKYSKKIHLFWILNLYKTSTVKEKFFNNYFNSLAGNETLKQQIIEGKSEEEIRATWRDGIEKFKLTRKKYLIYQDFE